ncbi:MAG: amidohydrolase family protein [Rhodococcus sp. (in: high G+C Gram-positive bacteria)]
MTSRVEAGSPIRRLLVSAGSRIIEPPEAYRDFMPPSWRDRAPVIRNIGSVGDVFIVDGLKQGIPLGRLKPRVLAGRAEDGPLCFRDCDPAAWDGEERVRSQDEAGLAAEVIYPSLSLVLARHPDLDYRRACLESYNRWLAVFCSSSPTRLFGLAHIDPATPAAGIRDLVRMSDVGYCGVLLPERPGTHHGYEHMDWDAFFAAAASLAIPLSFHIGADSIILAKPGSTRNRLNAFVEMLACKGDVLSRLVFSGVFERHPGLRVVCAGASAGAIGRYGARMDQANRRYPAEVRHAAELSCSPSVYLARQLHVADPLRESFQPDPMIGAGHWMWASSEAASPSQDSLERVFGNDWDGPPADRAAVLSDNVSRLYGLGLAEPLDPGR